MACVLKWYNLMSQFFGLVGKHGSDSPDCVLPGKCDLSCSPVGWDWNILRIAKAAVCVYYKTIEANFMPNVIASDD